MRASKAKYQLRQIMLAIAVLAGLFAALRVTGTVALVVIVVIIVAVVISLPILLAAPGRRLRAAVWVSSVYPFVILALLHITRLIAWCVLGHPPRPHADDPQRLSPIVNVVRVVTLILLAVGTPLIWLVYVPALIIVANISRKGMRPGEGVLQLLVLLGAWSASFAIAWWDPGRVLEWCFH
jgi:hypothetical protein